MKLFELAKEAVTYSYSPYSKFKVGCAIELSDGMIIKGTNIENVSYSLSMCAERVALFKAFSEGYKKEDIKAIAVYGETNDFTITVDLGLCLNQRHDICAALHQLIGNDESHISGTQHENLFPGQYAVVITHGLRCTCAHHARQCPAREADSVLCCACGDDDIFSVNGFQCVIAVFFLDIHCNHIVVI